MAAQWRTYLRQTCSIILLGSLAVVLQAQTPPAREYIRLGGRVIAIENFTASISPTTATLQADASSPMPVAITTSTAADWKVTDKPDWLTADAMSGSTIASGSGFTSTLNISAQKNTLSNSRSYTLRIETGGIVLSLAVTQLGLTAISVNPQSIDIGSGGGSGTFQISGPSGVQWNASASDSSVITAVTPSSGTGPGPTTINYTVAANPLTTQRTPNIAITIPNSQPATFTITQAANPSPVTLSLAIASPTAAGGPGSFTVTADSSIKWNATPQSTWIAVTSPSGTTAGTSVVNYTVGQNTGEQSRSGSIKIPAAPGGPSFEDVYFKIVQGGVTPSVTVDRSSISTKSRDVEQTVKVTANTAWSVVPPVAGWIHLARGSGDGSAPEQLLTFTVDNYYSGLTRSATITVQASTAAAAITVTQSPAQSLAVQPNAAVVTTGTSFAFLAVVDGNVDSAAPVTDAGGKAVATSPCLGRRGSRVRIAPPRPDQ
jgi:hypothetical protein